MKKCPTCQEGNLVNTTKIKEFSYKSGRYKIPATGLHCDNCEEMIIKGSEAKALDYLLEAEYQKFKPR
jgi:hypothetical protein